jgi:DNA-binding XRE family transcriptional regulator
MDGSVVNPLKEFRLAQDHGAGWNVEYCAKQIDVSASTIIRTEDGCYNDIPPTILRYIAPFFLSPDSVRTNYRLFKSDARRRVKDGKIFESFRFQAYVTTDKGVEKDTRNPFVIWRELCGFKSRLSFCKTLCLHPSTVKRLEDGEALDIPESVLESLREIELDPNFIEYLEAAYSQWRHSLRRNLNSQPLLSNVS